MYIWLDSYRPSASGSTRRRRPCIPQGDSIVIDATNSYYSY